MSTTSSSEHPGEITENNLVSVRGFYRQQRCSAALEQQYKTKQNNKTVRTVVLYICDHQVVRRRDKNTEVAFLAKYLFNVCNRQPFSCVKIQQLCILIDIYRKTAVLTLKSSPVKLQAIISSTKNEHSINVHRISIYPG